MPSNERDPHQRQPRFQPNAPAPASTEDREPIAVVGLGASAGGLEALTEFFDNAPSESGMAFVVVTHHPPDQPSMLPELIREHTAMEVCLVESGMRAERDRVYLPPPDKNLAILGGRFSLLERDQRTGRELPVDYFFRSLANDQRQAAIGIVLSGTGTDGTRGLIEIKGSRGMVMVQDPASASYPDMPDSAIATKAVDYVLPAADIPAELTSYAQSAHRLRREDAGAEASEALRKVLILLRDRTGHDFSSYKPATVLRRIERRMAVHQIERMDRYARYLQIHVDEVDLLFRELLIGVTSFFRDPEAFDALAEPLADAVGEHPHGGTLRVWVPGCSTGDEAYSLAILLHECMESRAKLLRVQIFATDLDKHAIDVARRGIYPAGIGADVSPDRLDRFFERGKSTYRVSQQIRQMVIFATQNLIEDPPFTRLDLISCRNVLIYLEAELQQRLLQLFHHALSPGGLLFLGLSESIGDARELFDTVDKRAKIFRRKEVAAGTYVPAFPAAFRPAAELAGRAGAAPQAQRYRRGASDLTQLTEQVLLARLTPPCVLVRESGEMVHVHGRTGSCLELSPGIQTTNNVFSMAREGLELPLASALSEASLRAGPVTRRDVAVKANGSQIAVDLRVVRLTAPEPLRGLFLISFEPSRAPASDVEPREDDQTTQSEAEAVIARLREQLQRVRERHQAVVEELEVANQELKSTKQELENAHEDIRATKRETQSLSEDLRAINAELEQKVDQLARANDDMTNLLDSTEIAAIFVDNQLKIQRFTDQARRIANLIPADIGRPITDLVSKLRYEHLLADAREVQRTQVPRRREVAAEDDSWYQLRILPYRTTDDQIEGLVMTFVDITETKNAQRFAHAVVQTLPEPLIVLDRDLRIVQANRAFCRAFALAEQDVEGARIDDLDRGGWDVAELRRLFEQLHAEHTAVDDAAVAHATMELQGRPIRVDARRLASTATSEPGHIVLAFHVHPEQG